MKREAYKSNVNTPDETPGRTLDAAACIHKREDQLRRTTRDLHSRFTKCCEADGGIFGHLL